MPDRPTDPVPPNGAPTGRDPQARDASSAEPITTRPQADAEDDSLERQRFLDRLVNASPDLIYIYDLVERRNVYANHETLAFLGYDAGRISSDGASLMENIAHPDDLPRIAAHHAHCATAGDDEVCELEYRLRDAAGRWRWMRGRDAVFTRDADGRARQIMGLAEDISERRAAEEELRLSRQRLDLHVQQTPLAVIEFDLEGRVREWNPAAVEMFGFSRDEAVGRRWTFVVPEEVWPTLDGVWERLVSQRGGTRSTNANRTKRGETIACEWFSTPLIDRDGSTIGVASLVMGVTDRKRAEEALRDSEQKYRALHESLMDAFVTIDMSGRITDFNQVYRAMLGYSDEELRQLTYRDFTPESWHEADERIIADQLLPLGYTSVYEKEYRRKDGTVFPVELRSFLLRDAQGRPWTRWAIVRDITARKQAEAERARLEEQVRQSVKMESIGRLAGGVAHDFNNMLQAILGNVEFAIAEAPPGSALADYLVEIRRSAERSADLTRQLLAFARKQTISPRILDLNDTVSGMLKMLHRLIGENIQLVWRPGAGVWPVKIDPGQVDQLLANLTVNARDAIEGGGRVTIETANVTFDGEDARTHTEGLAGQFVMLAVSDTGRGLDDEARAHLFEPFFTTKEPGRGTGLGLATVFGIVKQNNGFLETSSEPGQGTSFRLYLPSAEAALPENSRRGAEPAIQGTETLLLVEDEEQVLNLGRRILERNGYTVLTARTPAGGLALAASFAGRLHMLITDVVMPGMDGKELLDWLRHGYPGLKCLFMSGYTADIIGHYGVLDEGIQFLQKPFTAASLSARVRDVLGRAEPR